ncbi:MAG: hypothetical protein AAB586_01820 [Patescibacteria group bacterium]
MLRNLHHANLLIGTAKEAEFYLRSLCDSLGIQLSHNPDFFVFRAETFGVNEARELILLSTRKAIITDKIFLIMSIRLTLEAQNALLKTFEDPYPDTYFFLAVREENAIVSTLRSRMQTLRVSSNPTLESDDAEMFLTYSIKDRLSFIKKFIDEEKNLTIFLDDLLSLLRKRHKTHISMEKVYTIRRSIRDSIVATRLVLEHLAAVLP